VHYGLPLESIQSVIVQIKVLLVDVAGLIIFVTLIVRLLKQELRK
jgi:hypothetical protein